MSATDIPQNLRLLTIVAHPHDITYTLGTSAHHIEKGDSVTTVSLTDGVTTHNEELEDELRKPPHDRDPSILQRSHQEQAERKQKEFIEVCALFGVTDARVLPFSDNPIEPSEQMARTLAEILYEVRPHIVITHPPYNETNRGHASLFSHDHAKTGQIVLQTLQTVSQADPKRQHAPHHVAQVYYIGVEFGLNSIDLFVDITDQINKRIEAEAKYVTQGHTADLASKRLESWAGYFGWCARTGYAETYIRANADVDNYLTVSNHMLRNAATGGEERLAKMAQKAQPDNG